VDEERGTGRTAALMRDTPRDAVFIVGFRNVVDYARRLAEKLQRDDLKIVPAEWLEQRNWMGREFTGIVLDHDVRLSDRQQTMLTIVMAQVRKPK